MRIDFDGLNNMAKVVGGQLTCAWCGRRIPTKPRTETYTPKYPFCPWCGRPVTVEAQVLKSKVEL